MKNLVPLLIPLMLLAFEVHGLEPASPSTACERFIKSEDRESCLNKASKLNVDSYAVGVCELLEDDDQITKCWKTIDGKMFSPAQLKKCEAKDMTDADRLNCLKKVALATKPDGTRTPASTAKPNSSIYQSK